MTMLSFSLISTIPHKVRETMFMEKKEYRVVCSKIYHSDKMFIDIAATDEVYLGVTHEMLFYSRRRLCNSPIEDCGLGSVFVVENGQREPYVDFSQGSQASVGTPEYADYERLCESLQPKIIETFKKMRREDKTSTVDNIMSTSEVEAYKNMINGQNGKISRQQFAEKHRDLLEPQSPNEENRIHVLEKQESSSLLREIQEQSRAEHDKANRASGISFGDMMRRKFYSHDGD